MLIKYRDDFLLAMENKPKFLKEITEVYQINTLMEIWNDRTSVYRNSVGIVHMIDIGLLKVLSVEPVSLIHLGVQISKKHLTVQLTLKGIWVVWNCKRVLAELNKPYWDNMVRVQNQFAKISKC